MGTMVNRSGTIVGEKQLYTPLVAVEMTLVHLQQTHQPEIFLLLPYPLAPDAFTINVPTNLKAGATYMWVITQNAAGNGTIGFPGNFKFPAAADIP